NGFYHAVLGRKAVQTTGRTSRIFPPTAEPAYGEGRITVESGRIPAACHVKILPNPYCADRCSQRFLLRSIATAVCPAAADWLIGGSIERNEPNFPDSGCGGRCPPCHDEAAAGRSNPAWFSAE